MWLRHRTETVLRCRTDSSALSLRYFAGLLEQVRTESLPASYWQYLEFNLRRCERLGKDLRAVAESACRDVAQAD